MRVWGNTGSICVPVFLVVGQCCHALNLVNIVELGDTGTDTFFLQMQMVSRYDSIIKNIQPYI